MRRKEVPVAEGRRTHWGKLPERLPNLVVDYCTYLVPNELTLKESLKQKENPVVHKI